MARSAKLGATAVVVGTDEGSASGVGTECRAALRERGTAKKGEPIAAEAAIGS